MCVFVPGLWSLSSWEIGAALRQWPSSPCSSSFHLPSYLSFPPLALSGVTASCLIAPLLPLSQTLSKQLPRISIGLCARAPFWQKQLVCIFGCRQLISEALSALIISGGLRGAVAPDTLSHSSSSANTGIPLPVKRLCLH